MDLLIDLIGTDAQKGDYVRRMMDRGARILVYLDGSGGAAVVIKSTRGEGQNAVVLDACDLAVAADYAQEIGHPDADALAMMAGEAVAEQSKAAFLAALAHVRSAGE